MATVSGLRRRSIFIALIRVGAALSLGGLALACSNLGLSSNAPDTYDSMSPSGGNHDVDGGAEATAADGTATSFDAGGSWVPSSTNPLCTVITDDAGVACDPDIAATPSATCTLPDGGVPEASTEDGGIALACHVIKQRGQLAQACTIAGTGIDGASCETGGDCAPGFECVGMPGRCRHYCCDGDKSCGDTAVKYFCDIQTTADTSLSVPVCSPATLCQLFTDACQGNETCAIVKDDGTTSCVPIGTAGIGDACDTVHCKAGLTCLGKPASRECYKLCRVGYANDCSADMKCKGSTQLFDNPEYGICQ